MKATRKKAVGQGPKAGTAAATVAKPTKSKAKGGASAPKAQAATASKAKQAGKQASEAGKRAVSTVPKKLVLLKKEGEATCKARGYTGSTRGDCASLSHELAL